MIDKLPRKVKKRVVGVKVSNTKLRRMLSNVIIYEGADTWRDQPIMNCEPFCPNCGCKATRGFDHGAPYPEIWYEERCLRCDNIVGYIDNSPYIHALECKEHDYDPTF